MSNVSLWVRGADVQNYGDFLDVRIPYRRTYTISGLESKDTIRSSSFHIIIRFFSRPTHLKKRAKSVKVWIHTAMISNRNLTCVMGEVLLGHCDQFENYWPPFVCFALQVGRK